MTMREIKTNILLANPCCIKNINPVDGYGKGGTTDPLLLFFNVPRINETKNPILLMSFHEKFSEKDFSKKSKEIYSRDIGLFYSRG